MSAANVVELAEQIEARVQEAMRLPTLDALRTIANEAGIRRARQAAREAPDLLDAALRQLRSAGQIEQTLRDELDAARSEAEWKLGGCFEVRANKTWLVRGPDLKPLPEEEQRSLTADEKKAWIARSTDQVPAVKAKVAELRKAEDATLEARHQVDVAKARMSACNHDVDAATAELQVLAIGLKTKEISA